MEDHDEQIQEQDEQFEEIQKIWKNLNTLFGHFEDLSKNFEVLGDLSESLNIWLKICQEGWRSFEECQSISLYFLSL